MMLFSLSNIFSQQADLILALLIAILNMNLIEFNGEYFLQIEGLGMGTSLAPTLANIYVGCLEKQCRILLSTALILYLCYIDDILAIWDGDMASALLFIDQINNMAPSLKVSKLISNSENHLWMLLFIKDRDLLMLVFLTPKFIKNP